MEKEFITIVGCGWLGTALGKQMVQEGHTVTGSYRNKERRGKLSHHNIKPFTFILEQKTPINANILKNTTVLLITLPPLRGSNTMTFADHLKHLVSQFNDNCRVIYTSSTGIYPHKSGEYSEDYEFVENKNSTLVQAEIMMRELLGDRVSVLRLGGLFGKKRHPAMKLQGNLEVKNPKGLVNLVHQDDIIEIFKILMAKETHGDVYNVVYPDYPNRQEYYTKIYRKYGLEAIRFDEDSPLIERKIVAGKIQKDLGFKFEHSIDELDKIFR